MFEQLDGAGLQGVEDGEDVRAEHAVVAVEAAVAFDAVLVVEVFVVVF